jgi:DinB superfamily
MRNLICIAALLICTCMLPAPAHAQKAAEPAVKPAASPSQAVLDQWNDIGRKLVAMAEDFPEDKYDFKPTPAQRTFAEQLLHASGVNYFFTNVVLGEKPPATENPPRDQFKSKAEIAAYVKKSFADGAAAIKKRGDKGTSEMVVDPYAKQYTRISDYAYGFIEQLRRTLRPTGG